MVAPRDIVEDRSGETLDKYRLIRQLGIGGMGIVYEAEHILIGRRCAVKLLHTEHAHDPEIAQRMLREARAAAAVGHANIVETQDFGVTDEGTQYLVMELLEGESVDALLDRSGWLEPEQCVAIIWQVLSALEAAHRAGIVHRDLKPENIFIARTADGEERVKLLDFGISKFYDGEAGDSRLTNTGAVMGTPYYMSPEQASGAERVDARSDIWAVGVILYECLTGAMPFTGENYNQIIVKIVTQEVTPPREIMPSLPAGLEAVISRAMSKEAADRYASATEMQEALRPFMSEWDLSARGSLPNLPGGLLGAAAVPTPAPAAAPSRPVSAPRPVAAVGRDTSPGSADLFPAAAAPRESIHARGEVAPTGSLVRNKGLLIGFGAGLAVVLVIAAILLASGGADKAPGAPAGGSGDESPAAMKPNAGPTAPPAEAMSPAMRADDDDDDDDGTVIMDIVVPPGEVQVVRRVRPRGAKVYLDGKLVESVPFKMVADGKKHRLEVKAPRHFTWEKSFVAKETMKSFEVRLVRRRYRIRARPRPRGSMKIIEWK